MTQGAVSSRMPELPMVHLAQLVETGAWFAIGGVVGGAVLALLIRLRGWSWTCALPLLVADRRLAVAVRDPGQHDPPDLERLAQLLDGGGARTGAISTRSSRGCAGSGESWGLPTG
jgi:hypothetical protein